MCVPGTSFLSLAPKMEGGAKPFPSSPWMALESGFPFHPCQGPAAATWFLPGLLPGSYTAQPPWPCTELGERLIRSSALSMSGPGLKISVAPHQFLEKVQIPQQWPLPASPGSCASGLTTPSGRWGSLHVIGGD